MLAIADTHIGFDWPSRPRVSRRRRGPDFVANFQAALQPALDGQVDLVIHGGDLLHRSRPPAHVVDAALEPLVEVAARGVPVLLVPGNHERSKIPRTLFGHHPNLHVFEEPRVFCARVRGLSVAVAGLPFKREVARVAREALERLAGEARAADIRLLAMHQTVSGAVVGPSDFMFRRGVDVLGAEAIPRGFAAVVSGHIHRRQLLTNDSQGGKIPCPVVYPGSTERTSFAEEGESKGYALLRLAPGPAGGWLASLRFETLATRPMVTCDLGREIAHQPAALARHLRGLPADAVVRLRFRGLARDEWPSSLNQRLFSQIAPQMNVTLGASMGAGSGMNGPRVGVGGDNLVGAGSDNRVGVRRGNRDD